MISSTTPKSPPSIPKWEELASAIDSQIEQVTQGEHGAGAGMHGDAGGRPVDRDGPVTVVRAHGQWRRALVGWTFALPFVLLFAVFMAGPIVASFLTSFTDMRVTDIRTPTGVNFVGLDNYAEVLQDRAVPPGGGQHRDLRGGHRRR